MSTNTMLVELGKPEKQSSIDSNSLYWLDIGARKQDKLDKTLKTIEQELCETPDHHKTEKRLKELITARHSLWVTFQAEWKSMVKEAQEEGNIRDDVLQNWGKVEKTATHMIIKYAKEVNKLQGIYDAPAAPNDTPEPTASIKMKMD